MPGADRDAAGRRRRHVDVIDPDPEVADHAHPRQPIEHGGIDGRVAVSVNAVEVAGLRAGRPRDQLDFAGE
jgi:hypothetical protein